MLPFKRTKSIGRGIYQSKTRKTGTFFPQLLVSDAVLPSLLVGANILKMNVGSVAGGINTNIRNGKYYRLVILPNASVKR